MRPEAKTIKRWREDPVAYVKERFGADPDLWQREILMAYVQNQRLAMKACKGPGKTTVLSWIAWNFLETRPYPKIGATSITADNLRDGLWSEMAKWQHKSPSLVERFEWTSKAIFLKESHENWRMSAKTWSKGSTTDQQADTLAGFHADHIMFLLDEAGGYPDAVMAAAEAALANTDAGEHNEAKIIMAGNPTHLEGPLYRACTTERDLWFVVEITGDPDAENRAPRISKQWALEQIQKYGKDNPWVLVNVFGKFPPASLNALLGPDEVSAAMGKKLPKDAILYSQKRLGVDVARFGDDRTVIFPRQGLQAFNPVIMRNARTNEIAARVVTAKDRWKSEFEFIDGTGGWGAGVVDSMIQAGRNPLEINFAGKATDSKYLNKRAEMWFNMAEWIKRGGALPNLPELQRELTAPTYTFTNGKLTLERKDQIKERLGFSPDLADALCLTFALPEQQGKEHPDRKMDSGKHESDWNPFPE